jgi:A/G-specific adenine glycosylase
VQALAAAPPADVLRAWRGLGYNRRALALWRAAKRIVEVFDGAVPSAIADLESLPGVGPYTARAVAALAFGVPVGAVDTNVRRVLGRIVAGEVGVLPPADLQRLADSAVPAGQAAPWTHALMDVGATLCKPGRPDCAACPARPWCRYAAGAVTAVSTAAALGRAPARPRVARETAAPFRTTSRWLRGRILDRLREAPNGEWVVLERSIGAHDGDAIEVATRAMADDGLLELEAVGDPAGLRARLPIG